MIDEEISKIIEEQFDRAVQLLSENKDKLTTLANLLLEKEVIFKEDLEKIFGKRKYRSHHEDEFEEETEGETPSVEKETNEVK